MVSIVFECTPEEKDELIAALHEWGTTGIVEDEPVGGGCTLDAFFDTREEAQAVMAELAPYAPVLRDHGDRDYVKEFQEQWQPVLLGEQIWLAPPWEEGPPPAGRVRVDYQAGMACGSGAHPCTRLCLEAVERWLRPGGAVMDVGVGSGILLMAAKALGAGFLAGCDIDHDTVTLAKAALPRVALYTGSARCLRSGLFDIVIANISSVAAEEMSRPLRRICKDGGVIVVSGFRSGDIPEGYDGAEITELEGWACLSLRAGAAGNSGGAKGGILK